MKKYFIVFIILFILMGVFSMDILGRSINDIQRRMVGQTNYRINVVKGVVATVNINGTFGCYIAGETVIYPNIPTFSRDPKLQIGDKVTIEFINGCRETPAILAPEDIRERPDTTEIYKLFEYCLAEGATVFAYFYTNAWWRGQTFLTTSTHTINYVDLLLARRYDASIPGVIYIEIRKATAGDIPTGPILTSGETNGNTLPSARAGIGPTREWRRIDLTEYNLENATKYVITLHLIGGSNINAVGIWIKSLNPYPDGKSIYSTTGGISWSTTTYDGGFKIYGKDL